MIPWHPRSTSRLRCVRQGPLPRHARRPPALLSRATCSLGRAQHVWRRPTSPAVRPACASRGLDVSSTDRELPSASVASSSAPRAPPGFPPLRPKRDFTYHYTRWPRPPPAPAAPAPAAPPPLPKGAVAVPPVTNRHTMGTRSKSGYRMPAVFHVAPMSPVPKTFRSAPADPNWRAVMEEEHSALLKNHTWDLVPCPPWANVVTGKWIFKHKF
jgi:hypothetical protein